jgi:hypothetical protein
LPQKRADRNPDGSLMSEEELLSGLRNLLARHGYVTRRLIDEEPSIPCSHFYCQKFGGLIQLYGRIGYCGTRSAVMKAAFDRKRSHQDMSLSTDTCEALTLTQVGHD